RRRLRAEGGRGHQGGSGQDEGGGRGDTAGSVGHGDHSLSGRDRTAGPADRAPVSRGDRSSVVPPHILGKCHRNLSESSRLDASGLVWFGGFPGAGTWVVGNGSVRCRLLAGSGCAA